MCPDEDKAAFEDINRHKFFNTNNLWINLPRLKSVLEAVSPRPLNGCFHGFSCINLRLLWWGSLLTSVFFCRTMAL